MHTMYHILEEPESCKTSARSLKEDSGMFDFSLSSTKLKQVKCEINTLNRTTIRHDTNIL